MTHLSYILAAYLASAVVLIGMVAFVALGLRTARSKLTRLEEEGLRRRSEPMR